MSRAEFSKKVKLAAFERAGGRCDICRAKIFSGAEFDHRVPDFAGGANDIENIQCLCSRCHKVKTKADRPEIDKTRRIIKKRAGIKPRKGPPLPGTKASGWKIPMYGRPERRT